MKGWLLYPPLSTVQSCSVDLFLHQWEWVQSRGDVIFEPPQLIVQLPRQDMFTCLFELCVVVPSLFFCEQSSQYLIVQSLLLFHLLTNLRCSQNRNFDWTAACLVLMCNECCPEDAEETISLLLLRLTRHSQSSSLWHSRYEPRIFVVISHWS